MLSAKEVGLFDAGLKSANPTAALSDVVRRLHKEFGLDREQILAKLEELREHLRNESRDSDEDVVLEVMDFLVGWSSPRVSLAKEIPSRQRPAKPNEESEDDEREGRGRSVARRVFPRPKVRFYSPGTGGIFVDRQLAALWRDHFLPPTAFGEPTVAVIDLIGIFPTPSFLQDLVLPLAQRIRGGIYGPLKLVIATHDVGVADFLSYLARAQGLSLFVSVPSNVLASPVQLVQESQPVGDLTGTDKTTLNVLVDLGGATTASDLAHREGIELSAAGNRLTHLAEKGFVYRFAQSQREGYIYVDPRFPAWSPEYESKTVEAGSSRS
jgi:hypothetical protein